MIIKNNKKESQKCKLNFYFHNYENKECPMLKLHLIVY